MYERLILHYFKGGAYEKAIQYLKLQFKCFADTNRIEDEINDISRIGTCLYLQGKYEDSIKYYLSGIKIMNDSRIKNANLSMKLLYNITLTYAVCRKFNEASRCIDMLLTTEDLQASDISRALLLKANILAETNEYETALFIYEEIINNDPETIYLVQHNMAIIFHRLGKLEESIKYLTDSINYQIKEPNECTTESLTEIARVYAKDNKINIACIFYEYAVKNALSFMQEDFIAEICSDISSLSLNGIQANKIKNLLEALIPLYYEKLKDTSALEKLEKLKVSL
jgi:tetratricopeptide (TPR) repeat protein